MDLKLVDICAGIGGFSLSAGWAGIETLMFCEKEKFPQQVLMKNFPGISIHDDLKTLNRKIIKREMIKKYKYYDPNEIIFTAGIPCQPYSHAGKRKGKDDNRNLSEEYIGLIAECRPRWAIIENVAGLISMENGRTLEGILIDLENENYQTEIYNIPACGVGAWHKRERIWIVCHSTKHGLQNRGSSQMGQSGKVEKFKRSGSEYAAITNARHPGQERNYEKRNKRGGEPFDKPSSCNLQSGQVQNVSNSIELNDDITRHGPSSIRRIGQTEAEIQRSKYDNRIWEFEPNVGRVANGIPGRVDRLKGLGNAIVPQVAYEFFKAIVEYENQNKS